MKGFFSFYTQWFVDNIFKVKAMKVICVTVIINSNYYYFKYILKRVS